MENELLQLLINNISDLPIVILLVWMYVQERKAKEKIDDDYKELQREYLQWLRDSAVLQNARAKLPDRSGT